MRAAIIGKGSPARVHARIVRELGDIVAVCGRTHAASSAFGPSPAYNDVARILRECRPDDVHVCSPNHLHAERAIASLATGAHVVCETPMATSAHDCMRTIEAADTAGRVGAIAYTCGCYPLVPLLRHVVAQGGTLRRHGGRCLSQDVFSPDKYASRAPAGHEEGYVDASLKVIGQAWAAMRGEAVGYPSFGDGLRGARLIKAPVKCAGSSRKGKP